MTTPTFVASSAAVSSAINWTASPISLPRASTTNGDVNYCLVFCYVGDNSLTTFTPPAGWSLVQSRENGQFEFAARLYRKVHNSGDPSSDNWSASSGLPVGFAARWAARGAATEVSAAQFNSSSTNFTAPSVTPTNADDLLITVHVGQETNGSPFTPPSGMTEQLDDIGGGGAGGSISVNSLALSSSAATGTKTATASNANNNWCVTIALAGASAAALAGGAADAATAAGALTTQVKLAGAAAALSTAVANLNAVLSAAAAALATGSGSLGGAQMSAIAQAQAQAQGALTGIAAQLAGAGAAQATAGGQFSDRRFRKSLRIHDGTPNGAPWANQSGLFWAWWPSIAAFLSQAPAASGSGATTTAQGDFIVNAPAGLSVGDDQGFGIISNLDATPDDVEVGYMGCFDIF